MNPCSHNNCWLDCPNLTLGISPATSFSRPWSSGPSPRWMWTSSPWIPNTTSCLMWLPVGNEMILIKSGLTAHECHMWTSLLVSACEWVVSTELGYVVVKYDNMYSKVECPGGINYETIDFRVSWLHAGENNNNNSNNHMGSENMFFFGVDWDLYTCIGMYCLRLVAHRSCGSWHRRAKIAQNEAKIRWGSQSVLSAKSSLMAIPKLQWNQTFILWHIQFAPS